MNAPIVTGGAQSAARGEVRGRGRGGGRGGTSRTTTKSAVGNPTDSKIGPNRLFKADWVKDSILKDDCFVVCLVSGKAGDQQWTFHRPIGETSLTSRQWVATPTRDVNFLLMRRESEELAAWKRKAELAKRIAVLRAQKGRKYDTDGQTEVWTFAGAPPVQATIRSAMAAAKAVDPKKESEWLNYTDQAVRVAEQQFKEALRKQEIPSGWIRSNPKPSHETMGGPLGDLHQKAVGYLNNLSLSAARDKVTRVCIGVDSTDSLDLPDEEESDSEEEDEGPRIEETAHPGNWADEMNTGAGVIPATDNFLPGMSGGKSKVNSPKGGKPDSTTSSMW